MITPESQESAKSFGLDSARVTATTTITNSMTVATTSASTNVLKESGKKSAKDDKEPIQIIRGGRIITLPPIEAPATRSKRLQIKTVEPAKRMEKFGYVTKSNKNNCIILVLYLLQVTARRCNKGRRRSPSNSKFLQT